MIKFHGASVAIERVENIIGIMKNIKWSTSPFNILDNIKSGEVSSFEIDEKGIIINHKGEIFSIFINVDRPFSGYNKIYLTASFSILSGIINDEDSDHPQPINYPEVDLIYKKYSDFITGKVGNFLFQGENHLEIFHHIEYLSVWKMNNFDLILGISKNYSEFEFSIGLYFVDSSHRESENPDFEIYNQYLDD